MNVHIYISLYIYIYIYVYIYIHMANSVADRGGPWHDGTTHTPGLHHKISVFSDPDPGKS